MAIARAQTTRGNYDVFLSFRGEDTRKTFTGHLYAALSSAGLRIFRDDKGIERCENVNSELEKAIKAARSSIIVFSKDYASSKWCLDELVMILEHKRASGHVILPVFYDVDPSQVRHQTGSFAEAFGRHESECLRNKVEGWRKALREVANLAGNDLKNDANGHEANFVEKIVKVIRGKLDRKVFHVAPHTVGLEYRAKDINSWLRNTSADVGIAVICGMGGIGKTTIAKFIYNSNFERFKGSSFLASVREISELPNGLVRLQRQLLSDILKEKVHINSVDEGIVKIKNYIGCKRVLVVLDDVDSHDLFDKIIGMRDWFHPGSKIVLTTRNKHLLTAREVCRIFEVEKLHDWESLALFSWHAFKQDHPIEGYVEQSKEVARRCGGLPLALQILGSSLSDKGLDIWDSALQKLSANPDSQIMGKLRISYDSLQDDHNRRLFLYIACFFFGEDKNFTIKILDGCEFKTIVGINNLIDRCLLTINEDNKLMIHQLLRDMAREIVCQESPEEPGKRRFLWDHEQSRRVLAEKTGTKKVEALYLDMHLLNNSRGNSNQIELKMEVFERMRNLRLLHLNDVKIKGGFKDFPKRLTWLSWRRFPLKSIPSDFPMESLVALDLSHSKLEHVWKGTKLLKLLKILNLSHCHGLTNTPNFTLCPNLEDLILEDCIHLVNVHKSIGELKKLVALNLKGCKNLKNLPSEFHCLTSLRTLDMSGCSKLEHVWTGTKLLKSLKILNLSHCHGLTNTPNFTLCPNLEDLILEDCIHLVKVHESIGELKKLVSLNMKGCKNLKKLPSEIQCLTSLRILNMSGCSKLDLSADGIMINRTGTTHGVESGSWLFKPFVLKPRKNPESIYFSLATLPCSLVTLSLAQCNVSSDGLARSLGSLSLLQDLNLSMNPISSIPKSIKYLTMLKSLELDSCKRLQSIPELPRSLVRLYIQNCSSLQMATSLPRMDTRMSMHRCEKLVEVQGILTSKPIRNVDAEIIKHLALHLVDVESKRNLDLKYLNEMTGCITNGPIQVLDECGIYSTWLPKSWFRDDLLCDFKSIGSYLSFHVPSHANHKIQALNVYILYAFSSDKLSLFKKNYVEKVRDHVCYPFVSRGHINIENRSKNMTWRYWPVCDKVSYLDKDWIWSIHWKSGDQFIIEGGDKIVVSVEADIHCYVKEVGVQIVGE